MPAVVPRPWWLAIKLGLVAVDDAVMRLPARTTAGRSALSHFRDARGRWRRRVMPRVVPPLVVTLAVLLLAETVWGRAGVDWSLGIFFGAIVGILLWLWDAPPAHIERWRWGAEGEKRTANALRALEPDGWRITHDVPGPYGNRDHVVIGPAGVFLLDSKSYDGIVAVDGDVVDVDRPDNHAGPISFIVSRRASAAPPRR